jgi:hypothetical protein
MSELRFPAALLSSGRSAYARFVRRVLIGLFVALAMLWPWQVCAANSQTAARLALIPPSPVTDRIALDIRAAVYWAGTREAKFDIAVYLDAEQPDKLLLREKIDVPAGEARGIRLRWPTKGQAGKHTIVCVARQGTETFRAERPLEVLATGSRSTKRLGGAWVDIYQFDEPSGKAFNADLGKMTDQQWRELVQAMHAVDQDILVVTMMFNNFTHRGLHKIETEGYQGKAFYPSKLHPGRVPIASHDPLETILSEADRLGMHVMPGVGCYAFFDFTSGSLRWHKQVADELWQRYGHHPSFYGWYISEEKDGGLGDKEERREIVEFFRELTPHLHRLAPEKPVMLATNSYHLRGAEETYRQLLPRLDILCPFAFHRMPAGDLTGEEAAAVLQSLCDEAGCHFWLDLETFVFRNGRELHPRPIQGLVSDISRFPNFEKILHFEFPGMMSSPRMSRRPGGEASVRLYQDYERFLREGPPPGLTHAAVGKPVTLAAPPDPRYPGGGAQGLVDNVGAVDDYCDAQWMGYCGDNLEAIIDLGETLEIRSLGVRCLQSTSSGIYLPKEARFAVSDNGRDFVEAATARPVLSPGVPGPQISMLTAEDLAVRGRFVKVHASNIGLIPPDKPGAGAKAWLFVDELLVNPRNTSSAAPPKNPTKKLTSQRPSTHARLPVHLRHLPNRHPQHVADAFASCQNRGRFETAMRQAMLATRIAAGAELAPVGRGD